MMLSTTNKYFLVFIVLACLAPTQTNAHGYLSNPRPRQFRQATSEWWTINVHNGGGLMKYANTNPPNNDVANLNGVRGGAPSNQETSGYTLGDHGLCGDKGDRKAFMAGGAFGPQSPKVTYTAGGVARIEAAITAYHAGHFEFRLAVPSDGGSDRTTPITQAMLNKHVLEIAPSTPFYDAVKDYQGMQGYGGWTGHGGEFRCKHTGEGYVDATATSAQIRWPHGSCCNGGGACSDPEHNTDRYIVEYGVNGYDKPETRNAFQTTYTVDLKIPDGIQCERCVLQWTYQTANSADGWPETFYNCADVEIVNNGGATTPAKPVLVTTSTADSPPVTAVTTAAIATTTPTAAAPPPPSPVTNCMSPIAAWSKCGGKGFTGSTCCVSGHICSKQSEWYSQCIPSLAPAAPAPAPAPDVTTTINVMTSTIITTVAATPAPAPIDSTTTIATTTTTVSAATTTRKANTGCASLVQPWSKCGGKGFTGSTCCVSGHICSKQTEWYSSCIPGSNPAPTPASPAPAPPAPAPPAPPAPAPPAPAPAPAPPTAGSCVLDGSTGFEKTVSANQIHQFFQDWGLSYNGKSGLAAAEDIRSHVACAVMMKPSAFGSFCNSGNIDTDLREAAAFFANVRKETGGFAKMEEAAPHRYCTSDSASGASADLIHAGADFACGAAEASYHGRGAIQLSWNINYGRFSEFLYGDKNILLQNPDLVVPAGTTGWAATLWFWQSSQDYGGTAPPVQLDGCVPRGTMSPHAAMVSAGPPSAKDPTGKHAGMARTINIINGGWECSVTSPLRSSATARMESYLNFAAMLSVSPHPSCNSAADCAAKGINLGAGCPLLEADEVNACPLECSKGGAPDWTGAFRFSCEKACAGGRKPAKTALASPCL